MKNTIFVVIIVVLFVTCLAVFAGCGAFGKANSSEEDNTPKTYTLQYTDDAGTHTVEVESGMPYSISSVPSRTGYVFNGLFDAEVGGTQYVSASGASLAPFTDNKNMVLFPQYTAKSYTVVLDYQGAVVTGSRELSVAYGERIPELPKNLQLDNKIFAGWYTEANCGGTQIADQYGLLPVVSYIDAENFDLSGRYIYLYAGFEAQKFTVTCCFEPSVPTEEVKVEYNTLVKDIVVETRVNGKAPIAWSKTQGGEAFIGKIIGDTVLYAIEYGSVIDFDTDGGNKINPIVERAGVHIELPTPTKQNMQFAYWMDREGNEYDNNIMPVDNVTLKAKWLPMLIFNENGGTPVEDIAGVQGTAVVLPTTEKNDYIFAGWYVGNDKYETTAMPAESVVLSAKYYKIENKQYVILSQSQGNSAKDGGDPSLSYSSELDLSDLYDSGVHTLKITAHYTIDSPWITSVEKPGTSKMYWYSQKITSDSCLVWAYTNQMTDGKSQTFVNTTTIDLSNPKLWICYSGPYTTSWGSTDERSKIKNFWVEVEYPDMTTLY